MLDCFHLAIVFACDSTGLFSIKKELYYDRSNHHEFQALSKLLLYPGEISDNLALDFNFQNVDKPYESYSGVNVKLRFVQKTIGIFFLNIAFVSATKILFAIDNNQANFEHSQRRRHSSQYLVCVS
jgi:hypothetical protein